MDRSRLSRFVNQRLNELPPQKRDIAMVFQFYALYPALNVGQNIAMPLHFEKLSKEETDRRVNKVAKILHLTEVLDRMPGQVSEGEKQRIAVARAIVRDPNCFLFDEPLSRLDVELRHSMRGQIKEVLSNLSKATVIVTHDQLEALTMADRIAIMRTGHFEQIATAEEIYSRPVSRFVASFMGEVNLFEVEATATGTTWSNADVLASPGALDIPPGWKGAAMVRPELVRFLASGQDADFTLTGHLVDEYALGSRIQYAIKAAGGMTVTVERPFESRINARPGDAVHLGWDRGSVHLIAGEGDYGKA